MNKFKVLSLTSAVSAGCHINDVMNQEEGAGAKARVSAGCHINDVMNIRKF